MRPGDSLGEVLQNLALVPTPPDRPPLFFTSATWLLMVSRYSSYSGSRQPVRGRLARGQQALHQRLVVAEHRRGQRPERHALRTGQVAMSTTAAGLYRAA